MNEAQSVERANAFITSVEAFAAAHPFVTAWIAATILSWLLTAAFKKPIRALLPDEWDEWGVRTFDVIVALVASFALLKLLHIPLAWLVVSSMLIGVASPIEYWIFSSLVIWKWPQAERFFTLRELAPPVEDPEKVENINSGEGQ